MKATFERPAAGGHPVVHASGEIDFATVRELRHLVTTAITPGDTGLVLDLSQATYVDSAGVHALAQLADLLASHRQQLRLVIPAGSRIGSIVGIAGLDTIVAVDPDVETAAMLLSRWG